MITERELGKSDTLYFAFNKARGSFYDLILMLSKIGLPDVHSLSRFQSLRVDFTYKHFSDTTNLR
jgi:hypothetical protein